MLLFGHIVFYYFQLMYKFNKWQQLQAQEDNR